MMSLSATSEEEACAVGGSIRAVAVKAEASAVRRWGHSATVVRRSLGRWSVLLFGGYGVVKDGGAARRLEDATVIDVQCDDGTLVLAAPRAVATGPRGREKHAACLRGSEVLVFFGRRSPKEPLGDAWAFAFAFASGGDDEGAWREVRADGPWPSPRWSHAVEAVGSDVIIVGGRDQFGPLRDSAFVLRRNNKNATWSRLETPGLAVYGHALVPSPEGDLLILGGIGDVPSERVSLLRSEAEEERTAAKGENNVIQRGVDLGSSSSKKKRRRRRRFAHAAARLDDHRIVVVGGVPVDDDDDEGDDDLGYVIVDGAAKDDNDITVRAPPQCRSIPVHAQAVTLDPGIVLVLGGGSHCLTFGPVFGDPFAIVDTHWSDEAARRSLARE